MPLPRRPESDPLEDPIAHKGARPHGRVVGPGDRVADAGVDAPNVDPFGQGHEASDFGRLADKGQQVIGPAEGRGHLIHHTAGRGAHDPVLDDLAEQGQLARLEREAEQPPPPPASPPLRARPRN